MEFTHLKPVIQNQKKNSLHINQIAKGQGVVSEPIPEVSVSISTKEALMITQIFPQGFQRFLSLPVLGPLMDRYAAWLHRTAVHVAVNPI